ncbi:MAG: S8 family peptidase [Candidatus Cybelea sp.]
MARHAGGGADTVFEDDGEGGGQGGVLAVLPQIEREVNALSARFPSVPAVLRVRLKDNALAKTHRPTSLFDEEAPIIGGEGPGELLVAAMPHSLAVVRRRVSNPTSQRMRANISTIREMNLVEPRSKVAELPHEPNADGRYQLKVKLFDYHDQGVNDQSLRRFMTYLHELNVDDPTVHQYAPDLRVFGLEVADLGLAERIAEFPTVRAATAFPQFGHDIDFAAVSLGALQPERLPPPAAGEQYPVVGMIDGGTDPANAPLRPWITNRYEPSPGADRNFAHGTFVAGLIASPKSLNGLLEAFPPTKCRIVDVIAMPTTGLREPELLATIDAALVQFPDVRIWNISLARNVPAHKDEFSDVARALDARQDRHNALFVIAAGNYRTPPLRSWPPQPLADRDRVAAPGDSARGLTVGSVAHLDNGISAVRTGEPSPFSRRGPGPSFIPKPELHHHGGNCSANGDFRQIGVQSVNEQGLLAEDVGTSFATPIISSIVANVDRALGGGASRNLLKALMVHSALLNSGPDVSPSDLNYYGFGKPTDVVDALACDPWSFTFLFEPKLVAGYYYNIWPFPLPACLHRNNRLYGEVIMTLVYDPPLDKSYGFEYCRSNVEVSFGTYLEDAEGKRHQAGKVPADPASPDLAFEKSRIEHGFKWSPTKAYRKRFRGTRGDVWRLMVEILHRSNFAPTDPQRAAIILTLRDPDKNRPVYTDTMDAIRLVGRPISALRVRDQARYRRRA